ncbi:hypothetical protein J6590_070468 [Homalodisca vitripennis]|nr:hypothetical protein J6590_070468 [Homalodisca vitripennis]
MSGKVATEEWLVRNVEGEVSPRFFSLSTSLSHSPPSRTVHLTGILRQGTETAERLMMNRRHSMR